MRAEYAASRPAKSSSSIWGLLFLAWMLSDGFDKSEADMQALRAEVASLRESMTADELRYAQEISVQEGWNLPEDGAGEGALQSAEPPMSAVSEEPAAPARSLAQVVTPLHDLVGTDDPVEAMFTMVRYTMPLFFLYIIATVMRRAFRG